MSAPAICYADDIGGTWNCVYYGVHIKGNPCLAPPDYKCKHKKEPKETKEGIPAPLSQRMRAFSDKLMNAYLDYESVVKLDSVDVNRELIAFARKVLPLLDGPEFEPLTSGVAGLEARAQGDKEIADRARKLKAILESKCKGETSDYQQMFDGFALDVVNTILENEKNVAVGVVGEAQRT